MSEEQTTDTQTSIPAETDSQTVSAATDEGTSTADNGQPESVDTFFDPKKVPEELLPAYKQMQADYTRKTQAIAEERKLAQQWKTDAEAYSKYKQHVPILEEMLKAPQGLGPTPELKALQDQLKAEGYDQDTIDLMTKSSEFLLKLLNQRQTAEEQQVAQQREVERINTGIAEAGKVDERLNDVSLTYAMDDGTTVTFGQIVEQLVAADPNWRQDPVAATKAAIKRVDALIGKAKTEGKVELSDSARSKASKFPTNSSSPQSAHSSGQVTSIMDAGREAMKELGIKG